jgi:aspartyl-tRNA synthetase
LDIADRYGVVQVIVNEQNAHFNEIYNLTRESVVRIEGVVNERKNANANLSTGEVEIALTTFHLYNKADVVPMIVEDKTDALEDARLKYRYLDLRRPCMQNKMIFRSKFINALRNYLLGREFLEIETPNLSKATPEGARDYLVPTRVKANHFYALPQSPQIYKQLLMVAGMNRYFQIARCFRDEDLRADRQPEFTQLDMEMSFTDESTIMNIVEKMLQHAFKETLNKDISIPFEIMSYDKAINEYGSDKPDLRYDLKLQSASSFFQTTNFNVIKQIIQNNQALKYIIVPDVLIAKKEIETLRKYAKDNKAYDLMYITYDQKIMDGSIKNNIELPIIEQIFKANNTTRGTLLMVGGQLNVVNQALGAVRNELGTMLNLKDPNTYRFV